MAKKQKNKIIVFANQKGGVGKTTLCTMFANYLAKKGEGVLVIDADVQQTISNMRKSDIAEGLDPIYNVQVMNIEKVNEVNAIMEKVLEVGGFVLIDAPGTLSQNGLIPIFANSDFIVCPYQYEKTAISSTVTFIKTVAVMKKKIEGMNTKMIFVPNRIDSRIGTAAELELWQKTDESLKALGTVTPRIAYKSDMQRYNSIDMPAPQEKIVKECFDALYRSVTE